MSKVAIVTDSTASIPENLVTKYSISVAPQVLIWEGETFEDGIDIQPDEFYKRLSQSKKMPTTSQVTPKTFSKIFSGLLADKREILAILVSTPLSGTVASALQIKQTMPEAPIEIVDSTSVSMGLGFPVLAAARAAKEGASLSECKALAENARKHAGVIFAVDTLEFLHRGGRIGGASRFLGTALKLKPILEIQDGRIEGVAKVRTRSKSISCIMDMVEERINGRTPLHLGILHANVPADAQKLLSETKDRFKAVEYLVSDISPVLGTHAGPGTVGLAYIAGNINNPI
jgi:DegV family protein with EDD domain